MKLTEADKQLFTSLNKVETGKALLDYLDRLQLSLCDSRNWGENDTKEVMNASADIIQREIVDKIKLRHTPTRSEQNEYE